MWLYLGIISALFLGVYDVVKKHALKENAVLPVLFFSTVFGCALMLSLLVVSKIAPQILVGTWLELQEIADHEHFLIFLKSLLVSVSWILAYFALKNLPISLVAPIRASGPVWTLILAVVFLGERPSGFQILGFVIIITSYYIFSALSLKEGISFRRNKWIFFIFGATLLGSFSNLYDKYLLNTIKINPVTVQLWFAIYLVVIIGTVLMLFWYPKRKANTAFTWRWTIPIIGIFLILADFVYFNALAIEGAVVSLVAALRRCSVVISFFLGAVLFKELNLKQKTAALAGVMVGAFLIIGG